MNNVYLKPFVFQANRFEEYVDGRCISKGTCNTTISSQLINNNCVGFILTNSIPVNINSKFELPVMGENGGDVLPDRIQYGRLYTLYSDDSYEPIVCNLFNNMTCIRFATLSPLRIIEFYGEYTEIL